jgi:hypothetical protein
MSLAELANMFAKNLEYLLTNFCQKSDVSRVDRADVPNRFESLRSYGKLPQGRENRAKRLSSAEITAAIFGLVPVSPNWAGHTATILGDMLPVGGADNSFHGAVNLTAAIELLLEDSAARNHFSFLTLSVAERFTNSHGSAVCYYLDGEILRQAAFVSKMATSLQQPGAERDFDINKTHAPMSRAVIFNAAFFERIAREVARSAMLPEPAGDGSEYNAEEALQARFKALGVRTGSRFMNIGVDTQVTWPKEEVLIKFDRYHLVLMPKTKDNTQSIHVDLYANQLNDDQAMTVINRFLSVLSWCDDQFAISEGGWSGNPVPVAVSKRNLGFVTAYEWPFHRNISPSDEIRRALALHREGQNAEEASLTSYAVLSYFKIIEIRYPTGKKVKNWIAQNFPAIAASTGNDAQIKDFMAACGSETPENYIYDACRLAVAHASIDHPSDADDLNEIRRLHSASYVLRQLARHMISQELGVSDNIYSGD